jgi:ParB family chromosome partitioning protein
VLIACLNGNRKPADPHWMPSYMAFPQGSYRTQEEAVENPTSQAA